MKFKDWVTQHDPELDWNFDNPEILMQQLILTAYSTGHLDIITVFNEMFLNDDPGLTVEQNDRFLEKQPKEIPND